MNFRSFPRLVQRWLSRPGTEFIACLALASPFFISGVGKLSDFQGAISEMAGVGLRPGGYFAAAVIVTQLGGSFLFLNRRTCWLGASILGIFTFLATLLAHRFWEFSGPARAGEMATFFEHLAIIGGFALAAALVIRTRETP